MYDPDLFELDCGQSRCVLPIDGLGRGRLLCELRGHDDEEEDDDEEDYDEGEDIDATSDGEFSIPNLDSDDLLGSGSQGGRVRRRSRNSSTSLPTTLALTSKSPPLRLAYSAPDPSTPLR